MLKGLLFVLVGLYVLFVVGFLVKRVREGGVKALFLKASASLTFVMCAIVSLMIAPENNYYGILIIIGMVFGVLGDVWLDLKYIHKDYEEAYTFAGITTFLVGHLFYIAGILSVYPEFVPWQICLAIFAAVAVTVFTRLLGRNKEYNYGKFNGLVFVYSIITMFIVTLCLNARNCFVFLPMLQGAQTPEFFWKFVLMTAATVLFALSDLVLSYIYFLKNGNTSKNVIINHSLYYAAQLILALSICM
jgi:uncharacterized membrane protein YhhN